MLLLIVRHGYLNNHDIIHCWETRKFRFIEISGLRNQYLQHCIKAFYHDIDEIKKATFI